MSAPAHLIAAAGALERELRRLDPERLWVLRVRGDGQEPAGVPVSSGKLEAGAGTEHDDALLDGHPLAAPDGTDGHGLEERAQDGVPAGGVESLPRLAPADGE